MKGHISRSALCVFWLLACVTVTTVEGKTSLLSGSGLLRSSKYKEIRNIDSSVQAIRDKALFEKKGTKNSLIEKRYFNEGSLDSLEVDLPNNDEVIGFLFVKSNPYKDKVYGRYYSDLILAYSKTSLYLYDMAGALMSNLTLTEDEISSVKVPHDHREPNKANQIVFVYHAERTRFTEVIVSAKRLKGNSENHREIIMGVGRFITSDEDLSPGAQDRNRLPKELRGLRFEVEVQKTGRGYFLIDGDGRISKITQGGNYSSSLYSNNSLGNCSDVVGLSSMPPYHAYFTKKDVAIFMAGSMKVNLECPAIEEDDEIIFGEGVISKQNVLLYLTRKGKLSLIGLRSGECQVLAKFVIEEQIQSNFMIFQMANYIVLWPDRSKNYFNMYDIRFAINQKQNIQAIRGLSVHDAGNFEILDYKLHRHGTEDKFILGLRSKDKIYLKKVQMLRTIVEVEDDKSWKPPLFLIGIGLALLYQCFMRSNSNEPTGLSKSVKKGLISKQMNSLNSLGRNINKY